MNIKNELNFILQGMSNTTEKHLVFSRELIKKKSKVLPERAASPISEMFSARLKATNHSTRLNSPRIPTYSRVSRRDIFGDSKGSLRAIKELQDLCNEARMLHISSQISMENVGSKSVNMSMSEVGSNKDLTFRGKVPNSLLNSRLLDLSKRKRKPLVKPTSKSNLKRNSSKNSDLPKYSPFKNPEIPLPDLQVLNSVRAKGAELEFAGKRKRYQLIHI